MDHTPDFDIDRARVPSLWRRLGALLYDSLLLASALVLATVLALVPYGVLGIATPADNPNPWHLTLLQLLLLAIVLGFHLRFWTRGGQTLGMRAWRFRLIRDDGANLTAGDALRRLGWATLSLLPAGLGLWWCLFDRDGLAWHDRRSGTRPVMLRKPAR